MKRLTIKLLIYLSAIMCGFLFTIPQVVAESAKSLETMEIDAKAKVEEEEIKKAKNDFEGINFGVALSLTMDTGKHDRVESAELVNGIVRVTEEKNDIPRVMLETHYFFTPDCKFLGHRPGMWGLGPFVGVQNGSNEIIESIGGGLMLGFRRNVKDTDSFNIGIGIIVDPSVKILGDGIEENKPLPPGETEIRYKKDSQWGALIMVSYAF